MTAPATKALDNHPKHRPERADRRSHQPVRRNSRLAGDVGARRGWEADYVRRMTWREKHELVKAARAYDRANKRPGARHGPLGPIALELLEELATLAVSNEGRVYPTLSWMQEKLRRSRDTIVRTMRALADAKILEWVRRFVPKEDGSSWERGPQVEQTSSIYRMTLPERLRRFVKKAPVAADEAERKKKMLADLDAYARADAADKLDSRPGVARALAKIEADRRAKKRESDDRAQTAPSSESYGVRQGRTGLSRG